MKNVSILGNESNNFKKVHAAISSMVGTKTTLFPKQLGAKLRNYKTYSSICNAAVFVGAVDWLDVRYALKNGIKVFISSNAKIPDKLLGRVTLFSLDSGSPNIGQMIKDIF